ncbi:NAD(P)/FAD-dependent oxidoreductase [Nocardia sp. NPDC057227]|uniref:NAD(P)/FAD-dependent oxidoreductase n=1 Tax=Nocardia sp. NPDC057227 TaxID=3346056 RepID=UPI00362B1790
MTDQRIVVLGAGYAGLATARRLVRTAPGAAITVLDARERFVERVRLHQRAAGQAIPEWDLAEVLGRRGIRFVHGRTVELDLDAREVRTADGAALPYDTLVYALGSAAGTADVPGAAEHALAVATPEDLADAAPPSGLALVVGAGATGVELATELAETHPDLRVLLLGADEPMAALAPRARAHVRRVLDRLGVEVRTDAKVTAVTAAGVRLADGTEVAADAVLWTTGFRVPPLAAAAGLAVDGSGRVRTDATLRSLSHPDVYAVGDAAATAGRDGRQLRMACATALPQGGYAATAIGARARGAEPREFRFRYQVQCYSLGRGDGLLHVVHADDSPARLVITGRPGAWLKERIVRFAARQAGLPAGL